LYIIFANYVNTKEKRLKEIKKIRKKLKKSLKGVPSPCHLFHGILCKMWGMDIYMKKLLALLVVLVFLLNSSSIFAASYFTNNKELDATFAQLEKTFLKSEQVYIPLNCEFDPITGPVVKEKLPKMTSAVLKAAVDERLNDIRAAIEIQEEELGGLSKDEYKMISEQLIHKSIIKGGEFYWEEGNKTVWLTFGLADDDFEEFEGLIGNFKRMGKEKDEVSQANLDQVDEGVKKYFNQSIQAGNKISPEIMKSLPGMIESLFKEEQLSKYISSCILSRIHDNIYNLDYVKFNGSESIESIMERYQSMIKSFQEGRDYERQIEDYKFLADPPSPEFREDFIKMILEGELSDSFTSGFNKPITLGELAKLFFESEELDGKIQLEENTIDENSPDYIKMAYIYGMINSKDDLEKPLTRLEAARKLVNGSVYRSSGASEILEINDCAKIPVNDIVAVANCPISTRGINFEPQSMYTKQEAISDRMDPEFQYVRGYNIRLNLDELSGIVVGENTAHLLFEDNEQLEEYFKRHFWDTAIGKIKINGSYMRIDTGCALIELFTPEKGIKFTFKNGVKFADFNKEVYGPELSYKLEPRVLKAGEKVNMDMEPDSIHKKLYQKLDNILAKIIKPKMTTEQKIKAIHDYVVTHIKYDLNYGEELTPEGVLKTLEKGRGVCGDYAQMFEYLCDRASIPCVTEGGITITSPAQSNHIWNAVFINGDWKFVDTTWDDGNEKKISYKYFLNDKFTFMKDHYPKMGVTHINYYSKIDPMNIKTQDELRVYLDREFYYIDGYKLTFRLTDKKLKPEIGYLWPGPQIKIVLTYDSKKDLYTVTSKKR